MPKQVLLPCSTADLTLAAIYVQETVSCIAIWFTLGFGVSWLPLPASKCMSVLPFVIAFILGGRLEDTSRQAFSATGSDPWFLFTSPVAAVFMALAVLTVVVALRQDRRSAG